MIQLGSRISNCKTHLTNKRFSILFVEIDQEKLSKSFEWEDDLLSRPFQDLHWFYFYGWGPGQPTPKYVSMAY